MTDVIINDIFVGKVDNPKEFVKQIRLQRRENNLPHVLSAMYNETYNEVHISTTRGRAMRPLIVVKDKKPLLTETHINQLQKNEINWTSVTLPGECEMMQLSLLQQYCEYVLTRG